MSGLLVGVEHGIGSLGHLQGTTIQLCKCFLAPGLYIPCVEWRSFTIRRDFASLLDLVHTPPVQVDVHQRHLRSGVRMCQRQVARYRRLAALHHQNGFLLHVPVEDVRSTVARLGLCQWHPSR